MGQIMIIFLDQLVQYAIIEPIMAHVASTWNTAGTIYSLFIRNVMRSKMTKCKHVMEILPYVNKYLPRKILIFIYYIILMRGSYIKFEHEHVVLT